jgi:hypothetical protein
LGGRKGVTGQKKGVNIILTPINLNEEQERKTDLKDSPL